MDSRRSSDRPGSGAGQRPRRPRHRAEISSSAKAIPVEPAQTTKQSVSIAVTDPNFQPIEPPTRGVGSALVVLEGG
jgi:hypothetical protein